MDSKTFKFLVSKIGNDCACLVDNELMDMYKCDHHKKLRQFASINFIERDWELVISQAPHTRRPTVVKAKIILFEMFGDLVDSMYHFYKNQ